jgi:hypothetical protein
MYGRNMEKGQSEFNISELYTTLEDAREEISRRQNDEALLQRLREYLGNDVPEFFNESPKAFYSRQLASPNYELLYFFDIIKGIGLEPNILINTKGKFISKNKSKYHLGNMFFFEGLGRHNGEKINSLSVVNFNQNDGKKFRDITTSFGENFVDFHHNLIDHCLKGSQYKYQDISDWLDRNGGACKNYYSKYLALFVSSGILFENFLFDGEEKDFTEQIVIPAIRKIKEELGVGPLIVPLLPLSEASHRYWSYYPEDIREIIRTKNGV